MDVLGTNSGTCVKKYTRHELFNLAKSLELEESFDQELQKLESNGRTLINSGVETATARKSLNWIKSLSSFGRQKSELNNDYSGLFNNGKNIDWKRDQVLNRPQLSRMTSSPSIRYNSNRIQSKVIHDRVPSNIQAKYAELIESFTSSSNYRTSLDNSSRQSTAARSPWLLNKSSRLLERQSSITGPIRNETMKQKARKYSIEEPLSLPYIDIDQDQSSTQDLSTKLSSRQTGNSSSRLLNDSELSPIQRISASDRSTTDSRTNICNEDDDFDITSLLSITVLSDIKTIRHDSQNSSIRRPAITSRPIMKDRTDEMSVKPLVRARTATEFTYNGRKKDYPTNHHIYREYSNHYQSNEPESLPNPYVWNHHHNIFDDRREMAREKQKTFETREKKVVDENVAQIIETFKAQVKARAQRPNLTELKTSSGDEEILIAGNPEARSVSEPAVTGVLDTPMAKQESKNDIKLEVENGLMNTKMVESDAKPNSEQNFESGSPLTKEKDDESIVKMEQPKQVITKQFSSRIPRLIRSHEPNPDL